MFNPDAKYWKKILETIIYAMKIKDCDRCICGSLISYKRCCKNKTVIQDLSEIKLLFEKIIKYKKSQDGTIDILKLWLFKPLIKLSTKRLTCIVPNCNELPINSHLTPKNALSILCWKDKKCRECILTDSSNKSEFKKQSIWEAWTLKVFCSTHDNDLFVRVDKLSKIDLKNKEQLFLLYFKTIAFELRNVQILIWIDYIAEIMKPFLILDEKEKISNNNCKIHISKNLIDQHKRLSIIYPAFKKTVIILEKKSFWKIFTFHRNFEYQENVFYSKTINPLHDLEWKPMDNKKEFMTINIFTFDWTAHVIMQCEWENKKKYLSFFEQLKKSKLDTFIEFINNTIELNRTNLFLDNSHNFKEPYINIP